MEKDTENQARPTLAGEVKQEVKAHLFHNAGFLGIDYFTLFWIFVAGCVFGLVVETVFHAIVYGDYESRAGLVWGPFSPSTAREPWCSRCRSTDSTIRTTWSFS